MLEEHRLKCEAEQKYLEAEVAQKRVDELRKQQEVLLLEKRKKEQLDSVCFGCEKTGGGRSSGRRRTSNAKSTAQTPSGTGRCRTWMSGSPR